MSFGIISIFFEFISFNAILVDFIICWPISLLSPLKGTNKPILIFSSKENASEY